MFLHLRLLLYLSSWVFRPFRCNIIGSWLQIYGGRLRTPGLRGSRTLVERPPWRCLLATKGRQLNNSDKVTGPLRTVSLTCEQSQLTRSVKQMPAEQCVFQPQPSGSAKCTRAPVQRQEMGMCRQSWRAVKPQRNEQEREVRMPSYTPRVHPPKNPPLQSHGKEGKKNKA